jgi:phosphoribosylformylglycinamidine synthase
MEQFALSVEGISEACLALGTPVVSGNVSFYNETEGRAILPTPTIGMIGLLDDVEKHVSIGFRNAADLIAVVGDTRDELGGSEFLRAVRGRDEGPCPELDLAAEKALIEFLVDAAEAGLLSSAHDVSDGGLAVALCESAFPRAIGARIALASGGVRASAVLFGESTGRALVSFPRGNAEALQERARSAGVPFSIVGIVTGGSIRLDLDGKALVDAPVDTLRALWSTAFQRSVEMDPAVER